MAEDIGGSPAISVGDDLVHVDKPSVGVVVIGALVLETMAVEVSWCELCSDLCT